MIDLKIVEIVHHLSIEKFGGGHGVRDMKALEAAIARPYATFDGQELYPAAVEKAAAVFESLIINHPFIDGNKRTSYVIMRLMLMNESLDISATLEEKYAFVIAASKGEIKVEEITKWLYGHLLSKNNESDTLGIP